MIFNTKMQTEHLAKLNSKPLNSDQADKALRLVIINEKDLRKSNGSMGKIALRASS